MDALSSGNAKNAAISMALRPEPAAHQVLLVNESLKMGKVRSASGKGLGI
jgi:hypothetical protein